MSPAGTLGEDCDLSAWARDYATAVVNGDVWPLNDSHVDLSRITFETSSRMQRRHGVCVTGKDGCCTVRLSQKTHDRAGLDAMRETVRHELVHCHQHQTPGLEPGHGDSFSRWVDPLSLSGRCSSHYDRRPADFNYRFFCSDGCGFVGGRHRFSVAVERAIHGRQVCASCTGELRVETETGVLKTVPDRIED